MILLDFGLTIRIQNLKMVNKERIRSVLRQLQAMLEACDTVCFGAAVQSLLQDRGGRRPRTVAEIRSVCRRLMRGAPGLAERNVCTISRRDCAELIQMASTPRQQYKLRTILHGVFEHCRRQEWLVDNPVELILPPRLNELEITPLSWQELTRLLHLARNEKHRSCMPPLGLMLWAGVRPAELLRLTWEDIGWEDSVISLRPQHSKTGGSRHIQLHAVLRSWLLEHGVAQGPLCPPNWLRRWRQLRDVAGLIPWRQDVLRHTFASYHAKHFHDFSRLQEDMGHRSAALLRTRYLNMKGLTAEHARIFWTPGKL